MCNLPGKWVVPDDVCCFCTAKPGHSYEWTRVCYFAVKQNVFPASTDDFQEVKVF